VDYDGAEQQDRAPRSVTKPPRTDTSRRRSTARTFRQVPAQAPDRSGAPPRPAFSTSHLGPGGAGRSAPNWSRRGGGRHSHDASPLDPARSSAIRDLATFANAAGSSRPGRGAVASCCRARATRRRRPASQGPSGTSAGRRPRAPSSQSWTTSAMNSRPLSALISVRRPCFANSFSRCLTTSFAPMLRATWLPRATLVYSSMTFNVRVDARHRSCGSRSRRTRCGLSVATRVGPTRGHDLRPRARRWPASWWGSVCRHQCWPITTGGSVALSEALHHQASTNIRDTTSPVRPPARSTP